MRLLLAMTICIVLSCFTTFSVFAVTQADIVDARAEIAAALYAASATQAAVQKMEDARLGVAETQIAELQKKVHSGERREELTKAQEQFVAALEAKDRAYAREMAVFRGAVTDIASTLEGAAALARFNNGDEAGALAILDKLQAANDAARKARADIESAAEERRIADLALEARQRGKVSAASVIARYETVTRLDPSVARDWLNLTILYVAADRTDDAVRAAQKALPLASDDAERSTAFRYKGLALERQGNLSGALDSYQLELEAYRRMLADADKKVADNRKAEDCPKSAGDRQPANDRVFDECIVISDPTESPESIYADIAIAQLDIGNISRLRGDFGGARRLYDEAMSAIQKPEFREVKAVGLARFGDLLRSMGNVAGAVTDYQQSRQLLREILAAEPGNEVGWRRNLATVEFRLAGLPNSDVRWPDVVAEFESMERAGILDPADRHYLDEARANAARETKP